MASIFGKSALGSPWKELFADVGKLNEHFKQGHKAEIHDAVIENYDLSGAPFEDAKFENTEWRKVVVRNALFKNTTFHKCKMESLELEQSTFENVTFEDCELTDVSFFESKLPGVRFINSKLKDETTFQKSSNGDLFFDHVTMNKVAFFQAQAKIVVKDSNLGRVNMTGLMAPSSLTFEKGELKEVNFSDSHLSTFSLVGVNADKYGFEGGTINKVDIRDNYLGIGMREVQIGSLTIERSKIESRFTLSKIDHVDIASCQTVIDLGFYKSTIGTLSVRECALENFRAIGATITTLRVKDSQLRNSEFKNLKAGVVTFENVTLDQKIDFTNAQIETLNLKGLVKSPGLNLITTGSNVKLD